MQREVEAGAGGTRRAPFTVALIICCIGLGSLDVALVLRNRELGARVAELTQSLATAKWSALTEGSRFPSISLLASSGQPVELGHEAGEAGTLLFVSSESCGSCDEVRSAWHQVSQLLVGSGVRVLELVLDATTTQPIDEAPYPRVLPGGDEWSVVGKLPGIPAAILIDRSGIVRRAFYGSPHTGLRDAVEKFLAQ